MSLARGMKDYFYFDTKLKAEDVAFEAEGTLYLGSKVGMRQWVVYDKGKEIADTGGGQSASAWLRVEARVRSANLKLQSLHTLPCVYTTLRIIDKKSWRM